MFFKYISVVIFLSSSTYGANILAIIPTPSYSHQIAYIDLWKELSLRGHKVTVVTTDPSKDASLTNLTEMDMSWAYKYFNVGDIPPDFEFSIWDVYKLWLQVMLPMAEEQISHPAVQDLIHNRTHFDVVLVEFFFPELLGFSEIYKCPKILISSFTTNAYYQHAIGNPAHPLLNPDFMTPFYGALQFKERITATLFSWYLSYFFSNNIIPEKEKILHKYFNTHVALEKLIKDVDLMFVNEHPVMQEGRAFGPNTVNIGGFRKQRSSKPLSKDLQEYLNNATNGFIYFSLGSNVKIHALKESTLTPIIEALREIPYKVLLKIETDELPGKPENVKLIKWASQQNILSHPNIKLFITQGGLQSMEETIYSEVPCVVIPFMADQVKNAKLMENKGFAKVVEKTPFLKKQEFKNAIIEVINNPRYKNSVRRIKQLVSDTPMTGLEKAVWWTEYVIRNKGAKHLRNPAADLPSYQYYLLDVIGFIVLATSSVAIILILLIKKVFKLILDNCVNTNSSKRKKIQ